VHGFRLERKQDQAVSQVFAVAALLNLLNV